MYQFIFILIICFVQFPIFGFSATKTQHEKIRELIKANQLEEAYKELLVFEKSQTEIISKAKDIKVAEDTLDPKESKETKDVKIVNANAIDNKTLDSTLLKTIQWAKAYIDTSLNHLDQAKLELSPLLDDKVWGGDAAYHLSQISSQAENYEEAYKFILLAEEKEISKKLKMDISLEKSKLLIKMRKWKEAQSYLQKIAKVMKSDIRYNDWLKLYVKTSYELKNISNSCKYLKKHYTRFANDSIWTQSAPLIQKIDIYGSHISCDVDDELFASRRRQLVGLGMSEQVQKEIQFWITKNNLTAYEKDKLIASQIVNEGRFKDALDIYLKYYEQKKHDFNYLSILASLATRAGETPLAIGTLARAYEYAGKSAKARQTLYQAAILSYQVQDYDGAQILFEKIVKKFPRNKIAGESKWFIAWIQYLKGHYQEAADLMMEVKHGAMQERVRYWLAMSFLKSGNAQQAKNLFSHIVDNTSGVSFYAVAAKQRLDSLAEVPDLTNSKELKRNPSALAKEDLENIKSASDDEKDTDENVVEDKDLMNSVEDFDLPSQSAYSQERLEKAHFLKLMGFEEQAQEEFKELEKIFLKGEKGKKLLEEYQQFQDYNRLSQLSYNLWQKQGTPEINISSRFIWESMFPLAFKEDVIKWGQEFSIPPAFLWGIMKAESQYRPWVISPVGALGLMQVMPFTGKKVADMLGEKEFNSNKLKVPSMAIKIGAKYMEKLSKNFQGSIPLMAAAYNAGPHRVQYWVYHFGYLDMDEWVEHIPFTETRNYVKRVVSNYFSYQSLYGDKVGPQKISLNRAIPFQITEPTPLIETWE